MDMTSDVTWAVIYLVLGVVALPTSIFLIMKLGDYWDMKAKSETWYQVLICQIFLAIGIVSAAMIISSVGWLLVCHLGGSTAFVCH